jgi:maltose alpha-D-glucosyltransferase/alpha-amylase
LAQGFYPAPPAVPDPVPGKFSFLYPDNKRILVFTLGYEDGYMLCVFNMAASPQPVEVALQEFSGYLPVEIFGGAAFPGSGTGLTC